MMTPSFITKPVPETEESQEQKLSTFREEAAERIREYDKMIHMSLFIRFLCMQLRQVMKSQYQLRYLNSCIKHVVYTTEILLAVLRSPAPALEVGSGQPPTGSLSVRPDSTHLAYTDLVLPALGPF